MGQFFDALPSWVMQILFLSTAYAGFQTDNSGLSHDQNRPVDRYRLPNLTFMLDIHPFFKHNMCEKGVCFKRRGDYATGSNATFEEYLSEIDASLLKYIVEFDFSDNIPQAVQKKLLDRQREYLLVGGMPEAILNYLRSGQFSDIIPVHRSIISTYLDDFSKYATEKALLRLQKVFNHSSGSESRKKRNPEIDF